MANNERHFNFRPFIQQINTRWHHISSLVGNDDNQYAEGSLAYNKMIEIEEILAE